MIILDNIVCRLIKKQTVTLSDIVNYMEFYFIFAFILYLSIDLVALITFILLDPYNQSDFNALAGISTLIISVFFVIPFIIIPSLLKYLLETLKIYDNVMNTNIIKCPKNREVFETENSVADNNNIKDKILECLIGVLTILLIIYFVLAIYYDIPVGPIMP